MHTPTNDFEALIKNIYIDYKYTCWEYSVHGLFQQLVGHIQAKNMLQIVSVGICVTSEYILIVLVLYLLLPPMGHYTIVIIHCKPWGEKKEK